jgi:hypothetical protein
MKYQAPTQKTTANSVKTTELTLEIAESITATIRNIEANNDKKLPTIRLIISTILAWPHMLSSFDRKLIAKSARCSLIETRFCNDTFHVRISPTKAR